MFPRSLYYAFSRSLIRSFLFHYYAFSYLLLRRFEFIIRTNRIHLLGGGALGRDRTYDLKIRNFLLLSTELRVHLLPPFGGSG